MSEAGAPWRIEPRHELPLQILIAADDVACDAGRQWIARVDFDRIDRDVGRLLPPLYLRLHGLGIEHHLMTRLRGVHRFHWYRNQLQVRALQPVLGSARERDIRIAPIGDLAVALGYCETLGARELAPIELLLPEDALPMTATLLENAGWQRSTDAPAKITRAYWMTRSSMRFVSGDGYTLVLRWRLYDWGLRPGAGVDLAHIDRTIDAGGSPLREIDPADLLLTVCALDPTQTPASPLWVANAAAIARADGMNWQRFAQRASEAGVSRNAWRAMQLLQRLGQPVPADVLSTLRATGGDSERLIAGLHRANPRLAPVIYRWARLLVRCRYAKSLDGLLGYLRDLWNLERRRDVLREASRRAVNRTTARLH